MSFSVVQNLDEIKDILVCWIEKAVGGAEWWC